MVRVTMLELSLVQVALSLFVMLRLHRLLDRSVKFMGIAGIFPFSWVLKFKISAKTRLLAVFAHPRCIF